MEEFRKNLKSLTNEELKNDIIKHNDKKLNDINKSSYLNSFGAILSIISTIDNIEEFAYLKNLPELDLFREYISLSIKLIDESLYKEKLSKSLDIAKNKRNEIFELLKILESYYIELSYVGSILDHHGLKIKSQEYGREHSGIDVENIIKIIHDKLEEHKSNYRMYNHIISEIVQFIPLRLTRDKYIDIVENSLAKNLKGLSENQVEDRIDYYKRQWDSSVQYGYGLKFDHYFARIQNLKNKKIKDKKLSELDIMVDDIMDITKDINELYNFVLIMGLIYNMIISIYLNDKKILDKDILEIKEQWKDVLASKSIAEIKKFMQLNENKLREVEMLMTEDIEEFEELNKEAINREDFIDLEIEEIFEDTREILTYYNDYNLSNIDSLLSIDSQEASDLFIDELINSLSSYIKRSIDEMDSIERRVRMKKLLSLIDLPFASIDEFEDYIRYSLNSRISSSKETLFIIENIIIFLKELDNKSEN